MKAMILAAGRGERLRPITDKMPKPLVSVKGKPLIQYHIEALVNAGYRDIVINHAWLGHLIEQTLGDGSQFNARIQYSPEGDSALETGGGIYNALPLLSSDSFLVVNGDIMTQFDFSTLKGKPTRLAHLVLVPNPVHNQKGDFTLTEGVVHEHGERKYTFSGIGVYSSDLFKGCKPGKFSLVPLLLKAMQADAVTGELYEGDWTDVGTVERLLLLDNA